MTFVLDNSVAMRWCFESATHLYAETVLNRLMNGETALVPLLWFYEASAVLVREQSRGTLTASTAAGFIAELQALPISADPQSAKRVFGDVHRLALLYRLTSYDSAYLELAIRQGLPLATLDNELRQASNAAGVALV